MIQIISQELGFNQSASVHVEVKPVDMVRLVSPSPFVVTAGTPHPAFPIGSTVALNVAMYDDLARRFDVARVPVHHDLTCSHVVQVVPKVRKLLFVNIRQ